MKNKYAPVYGNKPRRLKLKVVGYFAHYAFVLLALFPFLLTVVSYIKYLSGAYQGVRPIDELFDGTSVFILLALFIAVIQYYRLNFKIIKTNISTEEVIEICNRIAKINNWKIKHVTKNEFVATSEGTLSFGFWGEMITVIILENNVFVNSICDPYKRPNIVSLGKNKIYRKEIIREIRNASA
jgi:hypothetical protein